MRGRVECTIEFAVQIPYWARKEDIVSMSVSHMRLLFKFGVGLEIKLTFRA